MLVEGVRLHLAPSYRAIGIENTIAMLLRRRRRRGGAGRRGSFKLGLILVSDQ